MAFIYDAVEIKVITFETAMFFIHMEECKETLYLNGFTSYW